MKQQQQNRLGFDWQILRGKYSDTLRVSPFGRRESWSIANSLFDITTVMTTSIIF
ncbi:hypothetical protein [Brasilonema octagenarum]|uniref:hypothetical protein n=1 Tax=Brasilonema octagenarum TaxID=417105 RepID=UPI00145C5641|nr:hypothetical protein [Brasilonema octagenarum]